MMPAKAKRKSPLREAIAAGKKKRGRPKLSQVQKKERKLRTKISFEMNPYQLAILESWIDDQELLEGRGFSRSQAALHLTMTALVKGKSKSSMDEIVKDWTKRATKR